MLATWGRAAIYVGADEAARLVKIAHNVLLGVSMQALVEVTVLAERGGIRRGDFLAFVNRSVAGSAFTGYKSAALVDLDFTPTFTNQLLEKDLDLAVQEAALGGVSMPVAELTKSLVSAAIERGEGDQDIASLIRVVAMDSGLALRPELPRAAGATSG